MRCRCTAILLAIAVGALPACLPDGTAPTGRHLIHDRAISAVQFAPESPDGVTRLIVFGPSSLSPRESHLPTLPGHGAYLVTRTATSSGPPAAGLAQGATILVTAAHPFAAPCFAASCPQGRSVDSRGRILIAFDYDGTSGSYSLLRADLPTTDLVDLGRVNNHQLSPDGRLLVLTVQRPAGATMIADHFDGRVTEVEGSYGQFVGNDFFFTTPTKDLLRLRADGTPEFVASNVTALLVRVGDGAAAVITICRPLPAAAGTPDSGACVESTFLDPVSLRETALPSPAPSSIEPSPDGRKLLLVTYSAPDLGRDAPVHLAVLDRTTGAEEAADVTGFSSVAWRPGRDELWVFLQNRESSTTQRTLVWRLGTPGLEELSIDLFQYPRVSAGGSTTFTADGRHIFVLKDFDPTDVNAWSRPQVEVRSADQPLVEGFLVSPPGTRPGRYWDVGSRLLVEAFITDFNRNDIAILDPDTGVSKALATGGHILFVGKTRALAMLRWAATKNTGDLTLIDLDSGALTVLAENVYGVAQPAPAADRDPDPADPLASGTRVAFLVRNSFASPYDGLWTVALP